MLLVWVFLNTFWGWRIDLEIREFEESFKLVSVSVNPGWNIYGIKKYAWVWNTINFCILNISIDILSP